MAWPTAARVPTLWHDLLDVARDTYAEIARQIAAHEPVTMVADPSDADDAAQRCGETVAIVSLPIDDAWMRDTGPIIAIAPDGSRHAVHFVFNGWGGSFTPFDRDAAVGRRIAAHLRLPVHEVPLVLEGGAVVVDGDGVAVTTERCLLNENRNPGWSRGRIEHSLQTWFGVERVVWLADAIAEDVGTDGHVDNVVSFIAPGRVLLQGCDDTDNPNHVIARDNRRRLLAADIDVVEVPVLPYADVGGKRVPVPYVNLYPCNGAVLVPVAEHSADSDMLATIAGCFPGRDVVAVPATVLAYGGGGIHCITQPVPAGAGA
jgi:agmatine deiminase